MLKIYSRKKILKISNALSRKQRSANYLIKFDIGKDSIEAKLEKEGITDNNTLALGKTVLANSLHRVY